MPPSNDDEEYDLDDGIIISSNVTLLMDRFVSATSRDDAASSLEQIIAILLANNKNNKNSSASIEEGLVKDVEFMAALVASLQQQQTSSSSTSARGGGATVDAALVLRLYLALLGGDTNHAQNTSSSSSNNNEIANALLTTPDDDDDGLWLGAVLDVAADSTLSSYPRVLALQVLRVATQQGSTKRTQAQWHGLPAGLHRVGEMLCSNNNDDNNDTNTVVDEQVRNEVIRLAGVLAEWASVSKVWMFHEVLEGIVRTAAHADAQLDQRVACDALHVVRTMVRHADAALADLIVTPVFLSKLVPFLDLRRGQAYLNPTSSSSLSLLQTNKNNPSDDDLDDLIASSSPSASPSKNNEKNSPRKKSSVLPLPLLTPEEEDIIHVVFDILSSVLENDSVKFAVWNKHPGLCSLVWEMSLLRPPHPLPDSTNATQKYPCAFPSIFLQQRALEIVGLYFDSPSIMEHHAGLDRLLFLACTGGRAATLPDKLVLSQASLHVLRRTMTDATANELLMHTLAPPMEEDDEDPNETGRGEGTQRPKQQPPNSTLIHRLLFTAFENLTLDSSTGDDSKTAAARAAAAVDRKVSLAGSLGALAVFLTDEPRRSILLRVTAARDNNSTTTSSTTTPSLVDAALAFLVQPSSSSEAPVDDFISLQLLRFLGEWVTDAPLVVQAVLCSPHAMSLSTLFSRRANSHTAISTMTGLLLGLCMEYLTDESQCGGWTRTGILTLIQQHHPGGVAQLTTKLEALKAVTTLLPWSSCTYEWRIWKQWYETSVLTVRKRVVQELTESRMGDDEHDDDNVSEGLTVGENFVDRKGIKAMQNLVADQAAEIEALRTALSESQRQVTSQEKQLTVWKQRTESNPTELDELLTELTANNSSLEQQIQTLESEISSLNLKHENEMKTRDETYEIVQRGLDEIKASEQEACRERDTLRDEMTALSQAYNGLEEEYRRQTEATTALTETPAGDPEGSDYRPPEQPEGEQSNQTPSGLSTSQVGSTEVATLRAENSRMREEARNADEWMTMAVDRMNTMNSDLIASQHRVNELEKQVEQFRTINETSGIETAQTLSQEMEDRLLSSHELAQSLSNLSTVKDENEKLLSQMQSLNTEGEASARALEDIKTDHVRLLAVESDLIQQLKNAEDKLMGSYTGEDELLSLREQVDSLSRSQADMEVRIHRLHTDIEQRDVRIGELELSPQVIELQQSSPANEGGQSSDDEVVHLRQANDEAQEWMGKAMLHHQELSDELAFVSQLNTELNDQVQELTEKLSVAVSRQVSMDELQIEKEELVQEIERLNIVVSYQEESLDQNRLKLESMKEMETTLSATEIQLNALQQTTTRNEDDTSSLRDQFAGFDASNIVSETPSELQLCQAELFKRTQQVKALEHELDGLLINRAELLQKVSDLESIHIEAGTREEEISALRARTAEAEARKESIQNILDDLAREKEDLAIEYDKNQRTLEKIVLELNHLKTGDLDTTKSSEMDANVEFLQEKICNVESQLRDEREAATNAVQQWESSHAALLVQYTETEEKLNAAIAKTEHLYPALSASEEALIDLQAKHQVATVRVSELENFLENMKEQMTDLEYDANNANDIAAQFQSNCNEIEAKMGPLEAENERLTSQIQLSVERLRTALSVDVDSSLSEMIDFATQKLDQMTEDIRNLEDHLAIQEDNAMAVVSQWQDSYEALKSEINANIIEGDTPLQRQDAIVNENLENSVDDEVEAKMGRLEAENERLTPQIQLSVERLRTALSVDVDSSLSEIIDFAAQKLDQMAEDIRNLEEHLATQEENAMAVVSQWQDSYEALKSEINANIIEGDTPLQRQDVMNLEHTGGTVTSPNLHILELDVHSLQRQLEVEREEANDVVLKWKESHSKIVSQFDETDTKLKATQDTLESLVRQSDAARMDHDKQVSDLNSKIESLLSATSEVETFNRALEETKNDSAALTTKLEEERFAFASQLAESEQRLLNLQEQLNDHEVDTNNDAIARQQNYDDERVLLLEEIDRLKSMLGDLQVQFDGALAQSEVQLTEIDALRSQTELCEKITESILVKLESSMSQAQNLPNDNKARHLSTQFQQVEVLLDELLSAPQIDRNPDDLVAQLHVYELELDDNRMSILEKEQELEANAKRVSELEWKVEDLAKQLTDRESDASKRHESCEALRVESNKYVAEIQVQKSALNELQRQHLGVKNVEDIDQTSHSNRVAELESLIRDLQDQLANQEEHARHVVNQWMEECDTVGSQLEVAQKENEELRVEIQKGDSLWPSSVELCEDTSCLLNQIDQLTALLDVAKSDRVTAQKEVEVLRRDAALRLVQTEELQQRLDESTQVVPRQWQSKVSVLESRISEHLDTIYNLQRDLEQEKGEIVVLEQKIMNLHDSFALQLEDARADLSRTKTSFETQHLQEKENAERFGHAIDELRSEVTLLQNERDEWKVILAEKEDELLEANDALQLHLTDQVSFKATDVAASVLKDQINSMRIQAQKDRQTIADLRHACEFAETEFVRTRADLAALLGMVDNEENRNAIEQRTMEATETFQRTERSEIEYLKKSLGRALEELSVARAVEKEVEERAANASHQAMLYEQEVVNTKSDFKFLTDTMDEMIESESARRASLEYRISSLENEHGVLMRYNDTEMESLRNELSHITMERDRLFQALKESEKAKEIVTYATSRDSVVGENFDPCIELERLRIERAQLLSGCADDASRIERRLRETRAAAKASAEADMTLERELRVSVERSLENLVVEFAEYRDEAEKGRLSENPELRDQWNASQTDILNARTEIETLKEDCQCLRKQLETAQGEYAGRINQLTEECRQAKMRASQFESDGRYEAEVRAEVARLQASQFNGAARSMHVPENPADDDRENAGTLKMWDELEKVKKELKEERVLYFEVLSDRDDLLAMLAQHSMLKESLSISLSQFGGQQAVDAATKDAEEKTKAQLGKCVKL